MKAKKLGTIVKILSIIAICLISFVGIYVQNLNKMENKVLDYKLTKDLAGYREVIFELSDANKVLDSDGKTIGNTDSYDDDTIKENKYTKSDEKINKEESLTVENYEKAKSIIEKRLKILGAADYTINLDKSTGSIYLRLAENDKTDSYISDIKLPDGFDIKDSEDDSKVFLTNEHLESLTAAAYPASETDLSKQQAYLVIKFNKEGAAILKDLSENEYKKIETTEDTTDETVVQTEEDEDKDSDKEDKKDDKEKEDSKEADKKEETKQKEISIYMLGSKAITTSFSEPMENGTIYLSSGSASSDTKKVQESVDSIQKEIDLIESGRLPLVYKTTQNQYVKVDNTIEIVKYFVIGIVIALGLALLFLIIKFKKLLPVFSYLGFMGIYLLALRYLNVAISIEGIAGIIVIALLNYLFVYRLLIENTSDDKFNKKYLQLLIELIPALVISVVFNFAGILSVISFGMTTVWGLILMAIYNYVVTRKMIK